VKPRGNSMIRTVDLRVDYGDVTAVHDLNLEIGPGEIFGLIGPNGAGKTSTMNVLATLLQPTYGEVYIAGIDIAEEPRAVHGIMGYMPDWAPVYANLKVWEFLDLFAAAYGLSASKRISAVERAMEVANLPGKRDSLAGSLSRGMKQRLVLAKSMLHDPQVLILDEPASGLDPIARVELREVVKGLAEQGKTIMISSHILTELQNFCTSIGIMERGRLVVSGTISEIISRMKPERTLVVGLLGERDRARAILEASAMVQRVQERDDLALAAIFDGTDEALVALLTSLVREGIPVKSFGEVEMNVEDVFLQIDAREVG